jgi:hypothetical protein
VEFDDSWVNCFWYVRGQEVFYSPFREQLDQHMKREGKQWDRFRFQETYSEPFESFTVGINGVFTLFHLNDSESVLFKTNKQL